MIKIKLVLEEEERQLLLLLLKRSRRRGCHNPKLHENLILKLGVL